MSCANTKCKWHRCDGDGCKLFKGRSWERCRQSVKTAKPAEATEKKGQAK